MHTAALDIRIPSMALGSDGLATGVSSQYSHLCKWLAPRHAILPKQLGMSGKFMLIISAVLREVCPGRMQYCTTEVAWMLCCFQFKFVLHFGLINSSMSFYISLTHIRCTFIVVGREVARTVFATEHSQVFSTNLIGSFTLRRPLFICATFLQSNFAFLFFWRVMCTWFVNGRLIIIFFFFSSARA